MLREASAQRLPAQRLPAQKLPVHRLPAQGLLAQRLPRYVLAPSEPQPSALLLFVVNVICLLPDPLCQEVRVLQPSALFGDEAGPHPDYFRAGKHAVNVCVCRQQPGPSQFSRPCSPH